MYTRVPAEKKPNTSFGGSSANLNKKPLNRQRPAKKPNVRSTDYRILMQWILTNPDSITQEEFMFFQSTVGYQQALRVMEEGRRRKQLQKVGVPAVETSRQPNRTNIQAGEDAPSGDGLPENLKIGLENISGISLSDVKVHKNSEEPEKVGAQAYTQGTDIHIAPGQEKCLPHEGWHAVQQKQGRVEAEIQLKTGAAVNEDSKLEREACVMGARAERDGSESGAIQGLPASEPKSSKINGNVIQRVTLQEGMELNNTKNPVKEETDGIKTAGYGETSENVKKIQQILIRMNYWTGKSGDKATGYFGEVTKESLINYQTGYMKLGKGELYDKKGNYVGCGPSTARSLDSLYKLLNNSNVPEQAKSSIMEIGKNKEANAAYDWDIKAGRYNGYVKEAQLILMILGHKLPKYGADGKWDNSGETYEALLNFQKSCINTFDGINKYGTPESKKQIEHLQGIEPTGKLDKRTYEALEKEKSKKAATNFNKSPAKQTGKDNKGTGKTEGFIGPPAPQGTSNGLTALNIIKLSALYKNMSATERIEALIDIANGSDNILIRAGVFTGIIVNEPQKVVENFKAAVQFQLNIGTNFEDPDMAEAFASVFTAYVTGKVFEGVKLPTKGAPNTIKGFNAVESNIINEAKTIINSSEFAQIKAAHRAGQSVTVNIGGRIIQYEPGLNASGMTMFGENGFLIGNEAFTSSGELSKTVLHELYRLNTSANSAGVSAELAAQETKAAFDFAEKAIKELIK